MAARVCETGKRSCPANTGFTFATPAGLAVGRRPPLTGRPVSADILPGRAGCAEIGVGNGARAKEEREGHDDRGAAG